MDGASFYRLVRVEKYDRVFVRVDGVLSEAAACFVDKDRVAIAAELTPLELADVREEFTKVYGAQLIPVFDRAIDEIEWPAPL